MEERITILENELQQLKAAYYKDRFANQLVFRNKITLVDTDIELSPSTGTKIGTSATQKLAFYGVTPVIQQGSIADPSGGSPIDTQARNAISSILDVLDAYGLTA